MGQFSTDRKGLATGAAEINLLDMAVAGFDFVAAAGASNVAELAISVLDAGGHVIPRAQAFWLYLSDSAAGVGLTATTASGTVTAKSAKGAVLGTGLAKFSILCQTLATGIFTLEITDTDKHPYVVCCINPVNGKVHISDDALEYGA
jgi:hypothetical protein